MAVLGDIGKRNEKQILQWIFEGTLVNRSISSGRPIARAMLGLLAALLSAPLVAAAQTYDLGKMPVGFPDAFPSCFCLSPAGSSQSTKFTGFAIGGTGAPNYTIADDECTGKILTPATCTITGSECQALSTQSPTNTCTYDIVADPLHPGPAPVATVTENLENSYDEFSLNAIGGIIIAPVNSTVANADIFALSTPQSTTDPGSASITFTAANLQSGDIISWSTTTSYKSGTHSVPNTTSTFQGTPNQSITQPITGSGGKMTVRATTEKYTDTATVYIVGPSSNGLTSDIPANLITSELATLYQGVTEIPTPSNPSCNVTETFQPFPIPTNPPDTTKTSDLATQVAMNESNYLQFANEVLYNITNFWPYGAGMHRGLMQVPTKTMADAWNWIQNAQDGVTDATENSLQCKLGTAYSRELNIESHAQNSLPPLDACQLEEMALELYGPKAGGTNPNLQYYINSCVGGTGAKCTNGSWQWKVNYTRNLCGVCYVIAVRNEAPPSGGSATSCQPPLSISVDPPNNLNSLCCADCAKKVNMTDLNCQS